MNIRYRIFYFVRVLFSMLLLIVLCFTSCISEDDMSKIKYVPIKVGTSSTYGFLITTTTAIVSGTVLASQTSQNRNNVTRGVCWSTQPNPTTANFYKSEKGGMGSFTLTIDGLQPETKYYYRFYVSSLEGTVYGNVQNFNTLAISIPLLSTIAISNISIYSASSGGNVTYDGGATITARGVCWSTSSSPTIANSKTSDGTGIGSFTSSITGLSAGTSYFVRAYATNIMGTSYGHEVVFNTQVSPISIAIAEIPAGTFTMGSPVNEVDRNSDETQHQVTLTPFRLSKYEITNAQFAAFLNAKSINYTGLYAAALYPSQPLIYGNSDFGLHYVGTQWTPVAGFENSPVIDVTWYGAAEFATYVGGTLPTEAQWEYACRGTTSTPFSTGAFLTNLQANYNWASPYNGGTNTVTTYLGKTQPVGSYLPNGYGLYDMHGNVWEWCSDLYDAYITTPQTNPTGVTYGAYKVIRGGSWMANSDECRSAHRNAQPLTYHDYFIGFRVAFVP